MSIYCPDYKASELTKIKFYNCRYVKENIDVSMRKFILCLFPKY